MLKLKNCLAIAVMIATFSNQALATANDEAKKACARAATIEECYSTAFQEDCGWIGDICKNDPCYISNWKEYSAAKKCVNKNTNSEVSCVLHQTLGCITPPLDATKNNRIPTIENIKSLCLLYNTKCRESDSSCKEERSKIPATCSVAFGCIVEYNQCLVDYRLLGKVECKKSSPAAQWTPTQGCFRR